MSQIFTGEKDYSGLISPYLSFSVKRISKLFEPNKLDERGKHCRRGHDSEVDLVFESRRRRRCNSGVCQDPEPDLVSIPEGKALDLTLARSFSLFNFFH